MMRGPVGSFFLSFRSGFKASLEGVCAYVRNVLAWVQVLSPSTPLDSLRDDVDKEDVLASISQAEIELDDLAHHIADRLKIPLPDDGDDTDA
jgi:hypothetical protein